MDKKPCFYLASSEGHVPPPARACWIVGPVQCDTRPDLSLVKVHPPLSFKTRDTGVVNTDEIMLCSRHFGYSLFDITEWPLYVDICIYPVKVHAGDAINPSDLIIHAWGEVYKNAHDADVVM